MPLVEITMREENHALYQRIDGKKSPRQAPKQSQYEILAFLPQKLLRELWSILE